jgi:hypothetical protein
MPWDSKQGKVSVYLCSTAVPVPVIDEVLADRDRSFSGSRSATLYISSCDGSIGTLLLTPRGGTVALKNYGNSQKEGYCNSCFAEVQRQRLIGNVTKPQYDDHYYC